MFISLLQSLDLVDIGYAWDCLGNEPSLMSFARWIASSSVLNFCRARTGPNISVLRRTNFVKEHDIRIKPKSYKLEIL